MTATLQTNTATVAVIQCDSYATETVEKAIIRGINLLGGVEKFAKTGENILLKPNVLWGTDPARCVVTHPSVLRGTAAAFAVSGARLSYGDSPAGFQQAASAMKKCGYDRALLNLPISLQPFDDFRDVTIPDGVVGKRLQIVTPVLEATGIINCCKLKTHGLTRMTGAVKNLFGCIPSGAKGQSHARFPDVYDFSQLLVDIAMFIRPRLHIMDAIEAMEGNGPQSGTPKKLGVILLSTDPVALDSIACRLMNLDPAHVPTITAGQRTGLGTSQSDAITLVGDPIEPLIDMSFDVVRQPPVVLPQNALLRAIKKHFLPRPVIIRSKCSRCGRCISMCPISPAAISRRHDGLVPRYNYSTCIRCYCCQEVCPSKAITIKTTLIGKILPFASYLSLLITRIRVRRHSA